MEEILDVTGWSALVLGLSALFAGIGALRKPGIWRTMIEEVGQRGLSIDLTDSLPVIVGCESRQLWKSSRGC